MISFKALKYYFLSLGLTAALCFLWLILIPSDIKGSILFGFSLMRLTLLGFLLTLMVTAFLITLKINGSKNKNILSHTIDVVTKRITIIKASLLIGFLFTGLFLFLFPLYKSGQYLPYYHRLLPLVVWFFCFCLLSLLTLAYGLKPKTNSFMHENAFTFKTAFLIMVFLLLLWIFITQTGVGITRDPVYWDDRHPVPLLEGQLLLLITFSILALVVIFLIQEITPQKKKKTALSHKKTWIDAALFFLLWFFALYLWMQQPIPNSYFTPPVRPPNYEVYPFSDASLYDLNAQSILIGEINANSRVILRPLFSIFLAGLHILGGQKYSQIIFLQTILLSVIPSILYLIGKNISRRLTGLVLAVFTIFIELNTLRVASLATTSNTKLLMTELPTIFLLSILVLVILNFSQNAAAFRVHPVYMGMALGLLALLRSQTLFFIPLIVLIILFLNIKNKKEMLAAVGFFTLAVLLVIGPLIIRNAKATGNPTIEDPNAARLIIQLYQSHQTKTVTELQENPDESETNGVFASVIGFILENPAEFLKFVSNNFLHNEILSLYSLPVRPYQIQDINQLFNPADLFWLKDRNVNLKTIILLLTYLAIICIGIASAYQKNKLTGLIPLAFHLTYNLSNSLSRFSGWRFSMPVNWILLLYFSIGLIVLLRWLLNLLGLSQSEKIDAAMVKQQNGETTEQSNKKQQEKKLIRAILFSILIGLLIPATMLMIPPRYKNQNKEDLIQNIGNNPAWKYFPSKKETLLNFLRGSELIIERGSAFYPRFYDSGEGEPTRRDSAYQTREFPRLVFTFLGTESREIILPIKESPVFFPNGAEVIIVYQLDLKGNINPLFVNLIGENPMLYFKDSFLETG